MIDRQVGDRQIVLWQQLETRQEMTAVYRGNRHGAAIRDRQIDRQMGDRWEIDRCIEKQIDGWIDRQRDRQIEGQIDGRQIDRQVDRQIDRQMGDRQIDRQMDSRAIESIRDSAR